MSAPSLTPPVSTSLTKESKTSGQARPEDAGKLWGDLKGRPIPMISNALRYYYWQECSIYRICSTSLIFSIIKVKIMEIGNSFL